MGQVLARSEEHTSELQSRLHLVCRLLLEKKRGDRKSAARSGHADHGQDAHEAPVDDPRDRRLGHLSHLCQQTATTDIYTLSLHDALPISIAHCICCCFHALCLPVFLFLSKKSLLREVNGTSFS